MKTFYFTLILFVLLGIGNVLYAQDTLTQKPVAEAAPKKKNWYDVLSFGGYSQIRYNRLLETNPKLKCDQCDKSWGEGGAIFFRRARIKFSGNVHDRVYAYIQLDIASNLSTSAASANWNYAQLRDLYFDVALDKKKEFWIRPGLSKIPFGFENLQSSQNRIALDRADPLNSAVPNERDMGVFFYWAPQKIRGRFKELQNSKLKGTGDYGVFGLGAYNGQSASRSDLNDNLHVVSRLTYPLKLKSGQFIEPSIFAYTGYVNMKDFRSAGVKGGNDFKDQRAGAALVIYPQPIGFQVEYNIGEGPAFNSADSTIKSKKLTGGYAQLMYKLEIKNQVFFPYVRAQYYNGGKKHEKDAAYHEVHELEMGIEWQPIPAFEVVTAYVISDRTFQDYSKPINNQTGNLLRLQVQFNY
jgi:hypothetical protein